MAIHEGYRLGERGWKHMSGYEDRANCMICGADETMEHILLMCPGGEQAEVWKLTGQIWDERKPAWDPPSYGEILGILASKIYQGNQTEGTERIDTHTARLRQILVTEAAYMIWKLRNERVIQEKTITAPEIKNRLWDTLKRRRDLDLALSRSRRHQKKLSTDKILGTWSKTKLHVAKNGGKEGENGVLVGMVEGIG